MVLNVVGSNPTGHPRKSLKSTDNKDFLYFKHIGEMPEWSIGPHSKCGERATVPRVRIPVSPPKCRKSSRTCSSCFFHALWLCPAAGGQGCRSGATKSRREKDEFVRRRAGMSERGEGNPGERDEFVRRCRRRRGRDLRNKADFPIFSYLCRI